jgi:hypothetical protein
MKTLQQQFNEITLIKIFEIEVINKRTNETDYIIFNIGIDENSLIAQHESLNKAQSESNKIAFVSIDLDEWLTIDEHLEALYDECTSAIIHSEYFELAN